MSGLLAPQLGLVCANTVFCINESAKEALYVDDSSHESSCAVDEELQPRGLLNTDLHTKKASFPHRNSPLNAEYATLVASLRTCAKNKDLHSGARLHYEIRKRGLLPRCLDALVAMYAKCGALAKAKELLDLQTCKNVFSWNALIAAYARQGQGHNALKCFEQMQHEGLSPNAVSFACVLKACGSVKALDKGEQIYEEIARQGLLGDDIVLGNSLVDMYVKCGALAKAQSVLAELPSRDVVSWNSLITGYAQEGRGMEALKCYEEMQHDGFSPDAVTYICILKACGSLKADDKGQEIHDEITRQGLLENDVVLGTALVDMYAKCGALAKAQAVFNELPSRNAITWNALITGYSDLGKGKEAFLCYEQMKQEGLAPNAVTFASILKACSCMRAARKGEQIHEEITKQGILKNNLVLGTALVDMYAKCGVLEKAQEVLDELALRDVVSWNVVIAGYAQDGKGEEALRFFEQMQEEGLSPNAVTFTCILKACGSLGAADRGKKVHDEVLRQGLLRHDVTLGISLVDMYAKCGALAMAQQTLEELPSQNIVSWNALIAGYAHQGESERVLNCLQGMQSKGLSPNAITFSCLLTAFTHLGRIEDGSMYFVNMNTAYGIKPELEHYTCMVDLYGRAGHLHKAIEVIQKMPSSGYCAVWCALLGACRKWRNVYVGRWAYERAVRIDKRDAAAHVLMADIYAAAGMFEYAERIEAMRTQLLFLH